MTEVVAALIRRGESFLICRRPAHKARGGLWEFAGGKVEPGETKEEALARECREELDVAVRADGVFTDVVHEYPDLTVHLTLFHARITAGEPKLLEHCDLRWITPEQIDRFDFCPADETILQKIKAANRAAKTARARLFDLRDESLRAFNAKLIPIVPAETVLGVRTPDLRQLAKKLKTDGLAEGFLASPHLYHEEFMLHALLLNLEKDFGRAVPLLDAFLPAVTNWAVCDTLKPKAFKKGDARLLPHVRRWIGSGETYAVRYGVGCLMTYFLDEGFDPAYLQIAAGIQSEEYYVNMMRAWYFATALAKQYDAALPLLAPGALDDWTRGKTIQKALESYRVPEERKAYLRGLRQ